jgi:hypothetical protein
VASAVCFLHGGEASFPGGAPDSGAVCGDPPQTRNGHEFPDGIQISVSLLAVARQTVFPAGRRKQHASRVLPRDSSNTRHKIALAESRLATNMHAP